MAILLLLFEGFFKKTIHVFFKELECGILVKSFILNLQDV